MDLPEPVMNAGVMILLLFALLMTGLLVIFFFHIEGILTPPQHYIAYRDASFPDDPGVINAYTLTDEDLSSHPALAELIIYKKRVLFSSDPRQILGIALGWSEYSIIYLTPDEDRYLSKYHMKIVRYNGSQFYIERNAWVPTSGKCGTGMQC